MLYPLVNVGNLLKNGIHTVWIEIGSAQTRWRFKSFSMNLGSREIFGTLVEQAEFRTSLEN
jgi:hypothetical protein